MPVARVTDEQDPDDVIFHRLPGLNLLKNEMKRASILVENMDLRKVRGKPEFNIIKEVRVDIAAIRAKLDQIQVEEKIDRSLTMDKIPEDQR